MQDIRKAKSQLIDELQAVRARVSELDQQAAQHKHIEGLLRESEARYKMLIENQGEGIGFVDASESFLFANPAADELFGLPRGQLVGRNLSEFLGAEELELVHRQTLQRRQGQHNTYELAIRLPTGQMRTIIVTAVPWLDEHRQYAGAFGVFRDITERRRIEEELRQAEVKYRQLVEEVPAVTYTAPANTPEQAMYISPQVYTILGYTQAEWLAAPDFWLTHLHPDDQARLANSIAGTVKLGATLTREYRMLGHDGRVVWLRDVALLTTDQSNQAGLWHGIMFDITERKQAEEELHKLSRAMEQSPSSIMITDLQARIEYVNPAFTRLTGYTLDEVIGQNPRFLNSGQTPVETYQHLWRALTRGEVWRGEFINRKKTGELSEESAVIAPIRNSAGEITHYGAINEDITERKKTEDEAMRLNAELEQHVIVRTAELEKANAELQADIHDRQRIEDRLRRSEQSYRTLFDSAGDAIFIMDLNGKFLEVNQLACQRLGYNREELLAIGMAGIMTPYFRDGVDRRIEQVQHLGSLAFESAYMRRDGTIIPVELNNRAIEYAGVSAILSIARDLTDRKHAENQLRRYMDEQTVLYEIALRLNAQLNLDELLHVIVEQAVALLDAQAGAICLYDVARDTLVLTFGVAVYDKYIGLEIKPGEGLTGRAFQSRRIIKTEDDAVWEGRAAAFENENRLKPVIAVPLVAKHAVPGVLYIAGNEAKRQFDDHDARLAELFAAQAAVALENAQLYEAQQEQYRRLQESQTRLIQSEKMSALGRLVASIAHEINNPLQAVQGCLSLVRDGIEESEGLGPDRVPIMLEDLSVATAEVTRIADIVERLRDFYRPMRPGVQETDLTALIDSVLALSAKQLQHSRVDVALTPAADGTRIVIQTNADQLRQVILNLVLNAIDAMPNGGVLHIAVDPDTLHIDDVSQPAVRLSFTDTGYGIPPENLTQIFEPFFTTKENGTGLGLSISYDLIKVLSGELTVTSEVGAGTTFTIRLPIAAEAKDR